MTSFFLNRSERTLPVFGNLIAFAATNPVKGRWFEAKIIKKSSGQCVLHHLGMSNHPGEIPEGRALTVMERDVPEAARLFFGDNLARRTLQQAGFEYPFEVIL